MNVLNRISALIDRAVHKDTPTEEARTSALIAVKLIRSNQISLGMNEIIIDSSKLSEPWANEDLEWIEVRAWQPINASKIGYCVACKTPYNKHEAVAYRRGEGITHWKCRGYWTGDYVP